MKIKLETNSVKEILKIIKNNNYDIEKCFIEGEAWEDIRYPGVPIFKYFLKVRGK